MFTINAKINATQVGTHLLHSAAFILAFMVVSLDVAKAFLSFGGFCIRL